MDDVIVSVHGFRKTYGGVAAVQDLSFDVKRGEIFALLGPNGSGKTSTLESLEGLRHPDGGSLAWPGSTRPVTLGGSRTSSACSCRPPPFPRP